MRLGTMIDYKLRIRGIPVLWRTEITAWEPSKRFVDEQRRGPYQVWCHEHRFEDVRGGTRCLDCVDYAVFGGTLINRLFVRRDIESIFSFRQTRLEALLGAVGK